MIFFVLHSVLVSRVKTFSIISEDITIDFWSLFLLLYLEFILDPVSQTRILSLKRKALEPCVCVNFITERLGSDLAWLFIGDSHISPAMILFFIECPFPLEESLSPPERQRPDFLVLGAVRRKMLRRDSPVFCGVGKRTLRSLCTFNILSPKPPISALLCTSAFRGTYSLSPELIGSAAVWTTWFPLLCAYMLPFFGLLSYPMSCFPVSKIMLTSMVHWYPLSSPVISLLHLFPCEFMSLLSF